MIETLTRRIGLVVAMLGLVAGAAGPAEAQFVTLDFEDIPIPGGTDTTLSTYSNSGFTLTATDTATGFSSGFQAHGPNSIFFAGSQALAAFAPVAGSTTMITLTPDNGQPFSLLSIDLARNSAFDPAPSVTFVGTKAGGGSVTVTDTFTVTTDPGVRAFQRFDFTGFTDLTSVTWVQPTLAAGLHQFDNIRLTGAVVPEPASIAMLGTGVLMVLGVAWRRNRAA